MAFGQSSGPPASPKEIAVLAELLERLDFGTFPQANGTFTRTEIAGLTERLIEERGDPGLGDLLIETRLGAEPVVDPLSTSAPIPGVSERVRVRSLRSARRPLDPCRRRRRHR